MKKSRYTEEQIIGILRNGCVLCEATVGDHEVPLPSLERKLGF